MAVPRNRHSNARKNKKRAHDAKAPKQHATCSNCKSAVLPHRVCGSCGFYGGQSLVTEQTQA